MKLARPVSGSLLVLVIEEAKIDFYGVIMSPSDSGLKPYLIEK